MPDGLKLQAAGFGRTMTSAVVAVRWSGSGEVVWEREDNGTEWMMDGGWLESMGWDGNGGFLV